MLSLLCAGSDFRVDATVHHAPTQCKHGIGGVAGLHADAADRGHELVARRATVNVNGIDFRLTVLGQSETPAEAGVDARAQLGGG